MAALKEEVPPYNAPMLVSRSELPYGAPISERAEFLFQRITDPILGTEYTNAYIARTSETLTVPDIVAIRDGDFDNVSVQELVESRAILKVWELGSVFGVSPSYFMEDKTPLFSSEIARILLSKVRGLRS